jgi:hypothetical protein
VLDQLEKITISSHFRNSKRYPAFLRFVVEQTLAGRVDDLKERTLGIEVFARPSDYDTNADPVVRVTAGEIRKRLAQYYRTTGHEHELRIELPLGSYVPQFFSASAVPEVQAVEAEGGATSEGGDPARQPATGLSKPVTPISGEVETEIERPPVRTLAKPRFTLASTASLVILALIVASVIFGIRIWRGRPAEPGIDYFWKPILSSDTPALIVIGIHSLDESGKDLSSGTHVNSAAESQQDMLTSMIRSEMVPVSDIVSYSQLTRLLTERGHTYRTQGSSETTFEQLQRGPVILIGGFDNAWTLRLTSTLRYRFMNPGALVGVITDSEHPEATGWRFDNGQSAFSNSRDYAIVASFFDPRIEQRVLIAAGIGKSGTAAATEFLSTNKYLEAWRSQTGLPRNKNVEIVLSTEIVEGQQGPPKVIATYSW